MKARFLHGEPMMTDFQNGTSAVNAGDIIVKNNSLLIAHTDIPASALGAVSEGGGVYEITNGALGAAFSEGNVVRWDATGQVAIGGTVTTNLKIGPAVGADYTTSNATVRVEHLAGLNI